MTDLKTARSRWSRQQAEDSGEQLLLYSELAKDLLPGKPLRLQFQIVTAAKSPAVESHSVTVDPTRIERTKHVVERTWKAIQAGLTEITHFEEVALLEEGIGADRISDTTAGILRHRLAAYTEQICTQHGVPGGIRQRLLTHRGKEERDRGRAACLSRERHRTSLHHLVLRSQTCLRTSCLNLLAAATTIGNGQTLTSTLLDVAGANTDSRTTNGVP